MKTTITLFKKPAFILIFFIIICPGSRAQQKDPSASVKALGYTGNQMSFRVNYVHKINGKYTLIIEDSSGHHLFSGVYHHKKFSRIFSLPAEAGRVTFIIADTESGEKHFQASLEQRKMPGDKSYP